MTDNTTNDISDSKKSKDSAILTCHPNNTPKPRKKIKRCSYVSCRKRVNVLGYDCKCNSAFLFCSKHQNNHNCTFNYQQEAQAKLAKDNPVVIAKKIDKID